MLISETSESGARCLETESLRGSGGGCSGCSDAVVAMVTVEPGSAGCGSEGGCDGGMSGLGRSLTEADSNMWRMALKSMAERWWRVEARLAAVIGWQSRSCGVGRGCLTGQAESSLTKTACLCLWSMKWQARLCARLSVVLSGAGVACRSAGAGQALLAGTDLYNAMLSMYLLHVSAVATVADSSIVSWYYCIVTYSSFPPTNHSIQNPPLLTATYPAQIDATLNQPRADVQSQRPTWHTDADGPHVVCAPSVHCQAVPHLSWWN